ncbi:glycoside hydrolase family 3 domain protein [Paludibacter propionicigenes WB4]|uniref:Glycoside hydrolase family 3 domain protein n=1 Tax=Paludibacter propionicigenes (strain DSM 17365 / JCM 13257 / WB4) TaxID=694427 RepID=E4T6B2_PALPW|nr:glycoside hydrolase family 3 C-terminal domain-containing protein [Paludibacter propionicigenes]ADQ80256.1 glycoside hydrolase family 3 domain protein [Paludibacter propionicigenes WB4]
MKTHTILLIFALSLMRLQAVSQTTFPFQNTGLPDNERLDNLLSLMTLDEKVNALSTNLGVPRLGIRNTGHSEGLHGMALGGPGNWGGSERGVAKTYPTTIFPQAYGLGETWDTELIQKVADIEATEIRFYAQNANLQKGGMVMRAPNADLARDPRWGRTEESYGEDAFLGSRLTVAFVKGLQGNDPKYWKSASLMKHFLANSNEDGRDSTSSNFDERLFREYYSFPFYKGITEGGSRAFMASYNAWNGVPMTVNPILKKIARDEWGNNGIICTDGGALSLLVNAHHAFPTLTEGAAAVVKASVGQFLDNFRSYIYEALKKGLLTEKNIDNVIRGNFYVALKLGLLDADQSKVPYTGIGVTDTVSPWNKQDTKAFVRKVTAKSVVLLKNTAGLLPLNKSKIKSIAVIGPRANEVLLDWYSGTPPYAVSILQGIKNAVGKDIEVFYAPSDEMDKATLAARKADVAIVCVGNHPYGTDARWKISPVPSDGREAVDRKSITLEQEDLVKLVMQANPKTVMVLVSNFPFAINWSQENVPAILHVTNNSQELGNGLADVIFGDVSPAGRTTQTWVKSITDLPPMMDYDIRHGRTYQYFKSKPLYPFGFGLSYTSFEYSGLETSNPTLTDSIFVSVKVKNIGKRDGDEVIQLYVSYPDSKVERPMKQLKGFKRVFIPAGKSKTVEIPLKASDVAYWDIAKHAFVTEKSKLKLMIGSSSADIKLTKVLPLTPKGE